MRNDILVILCCPLCKQTLKEKQDKLLCSRCKKAYPVKQGVPHFSGKPILEDSRLKQFVRGHALLYDAVKIVYSPSYVKTTYYKELIKNAGTRAAILDLGSGSRRIHEQAITFDIYPYPNVDIVGNGFQMPFKDNSFDIVLLRTVLEHIADVPAFLEEVRRIVRKGGLIYAEVPFIFNFHASPGDYYRWTMKGIEIQFKEFAVLKQGIVTGASASFVLSSAHYLAILLSFGSQKMYTALSVLFNFILKPLSLLDLILNHFNHAENLASVIYVIAKKQ